jgi:hypothetical protein
MRTPLALTTPLLEGPWDIGLTDAVVLAPVVLAPVGAVAFWIHQHPPLLTGEADADAAVLNPSPTIAAAAPHITAILRNFDMVSPLWAQLTVCWRAAGVVD